VTGLRTLTEYLLTELSAAQIQEIIPHRYPFVMVDRILEVEDGQRAVGVKAVSIDEPYFVGHFPGYPVMPGVLIAEALAQVGAVAVLRSGAARGHVPFLAGLDNFRFRRQVVPGDVLRLEVTLTRLRTRAGRGHGIATVEGEVAAEGDITFVIAPGTGGL
jgi:3-hydroxyacyl-[acyl-carrier-protein] dehydratase